MNIGELLNKNFKSIKEMEQVLKTNKECIAYLEALIWEGFPTSPFDETSKVYKCKNGRYKCKNTGKYFNILTGSIFENTKLPLIYWFKVIFYEQANRKGVSSTTVAKLLGITQPTAWYMLQKIRKCMGKENYQQLEGVVEVDEYYQGGALRNMHYDKKLVARAKGIFQNKNLLIGLAERFGNVVVKVIPDKSDSTLTTAVLRYVQKGSILYTDENPSYSKLPSIYKQASVVHSRGIYVDKCDNSIYTNTIESFWSTFSRTMNTYIHVSRKHLQNYADEVVFRYNTRKMKPIDACIWLLQNIMCTRLTRKEIILGLY